jgi:hypothetical protein
VQSRAGTCDHMSLGAEPALHFAFWLLMPTVVSSHTRKILLLIVLQYIDSGTLARSSASDYHDLDRVKIGSGIVARSSTFDFQSLMGAINPENDYNKLEI